MQQTRRLAAILFTDIVGSTSMMQKDEQHAVSINKRYVAVLKECVLSRRGEILNDFGDGSLCCFGSATEALHCAIEMQQKFQHEPKVPLRVGLHVGEIFFEDGKVFGDGVNVASRIQSLGIANSILFSSEINSKIKNQQEFKCVSLGTFHFKNVDESMEVFALANEGLTVPKKEELTGKLKEIEKKSATKKWIITAVALLLLVVSYFVYQILFHTAGFSGEKTIAVLPFENTGAPDSEEYVSDGITQDIINNLSKISSLQKVIGWFSVRSFKKTTKSLKQIADELGVAAILSGTMEKHEGKVHIITELVEVSTNKRLWGDDFEYDSKDILSIQSKVAGEIISALKVNLTPEEQKNLTKNYTDNPEAYRLYRKGLFFWNKNNGVYFDSAVLYYKRALDIDPDYALAYSGLANRYIFFKLPSQLEGIPIAKMYAAKALSLDSNLSEAITTLGFIQSNFDYDWVKSKVTLQKALRLNPNYSEAHLFYGNLLQYTGESTERGIQEVKRALELDPLNTRFNWILGRNYYLARQYDLADEQLKRTLNLYPDHPYTKETLIFLYLEEKKFTEAFGLIRQLPEILYTNGPYQIYYLCYAYGVSGDTSRAKSKLEEILKKYPDQEPLQLAYIYIALKNYNEALNMLESAYKTRAIQLYWVKVDPVLDPIRNEPRFKELIKKMHLD
jgi:adenylate cyclase